MKINSKTSITVLIVCLVSVLGIAPLNAGDKTEQAEIARLREENARLKAGLDLRNQLIRTQEELIRKQNELIRKQKELSDNFQDMRKLAKRTAKELGESLKLAKRLLDKDEKMDRESTLPLAKVDGVIKELTGAGSRIVISVGSEAGLQKGHTLHVFRLKPDPKYAGEMQIESVGSKEAIGKLIKKVKDAPVQIGDQVSSYIVDD